MKQRLKVFGIYSLFWIGYFVLARLMFLLYEHSLSFELGIKEWILIFIHGLHMDLSSTGYIMALVGLIFTFTVFTDGIWMNRILKPLNIILLTLTSIIVVTDLELYENWGFRMDATPLLYITKPKEAMASTELWLTFLLILLIVGLVLLGNYIYSRTIRKQILKIEKSNIFSVLFLLLLTGSMILPIRGGIGIAPMNSGTVYFSKNKFANHASINVVWNVMHSVVYLKKRTVTNKFMSNDKAQEILEQLYQKKGKTRKLLKKENPNVVVLILESFSTKVIKDLGGKWNAAPKFNKLIKDGLIFTNFYANGDRSDKGLVSIIGGYPAQPTTSIMKEASKTQLLPSLFESFNEMGYKTSFYYGGDVDFASMKSYLYNAGVQNIISDEDFDSKLVNSKWGVHDEYLFERLYNDLLKEDSSYFNIVFTLSSHDPFDVPMKPVFEGNSRATKYLNSIYYTDSCLYEFMEKVRHSEIWNNTLFILVADHGSRRPGKSKNHEIDKFQIPMLWMGGVLSDSVKLNDIVASQIDIPATILGQFNKKAKHFSYSKDLFLENQNEFAYYVFNNGFGFITDSTKLIYDNVGDILILQEGNVEQDLKKGKAFLQVISEDYLKR